MPICILWLSLVISGYLFLTILSQIAQSALKVEHVICISGPRYTGKSYLAELLARNLLGELKPDEAHNVIIYESGELQGQPALSKWVESE